MASSRNVRSQKLSSGLFSIFTTGSFTIESGQNVFSFSTKHEVCKTRIAKDLLLLIGNHCHLIRTVEVALPLTFATLSAGTNRVFSCSLQLMEATNRVNPVSDVFQQSHKRCHFHTNTLVELLSNAFAAPLTFFNNSLQRQGFGSPFGGFLIVETSFA